MRQWLKNQWCTLVYIVSAVILTVFVICVSCGVLSIERTYNWMFGYREMVDERIEHKLGPVESRLKALEGNTNAWQTTGVK
jgi:hypothetical protein